MTGEIMALVQQEINKLLKAGFIRTSRIVEWISNIVPVKKKNGKIRVCIDFRDLNRSTPKDEYPMPVADMLIDNTTGFRVFSFMDGYSGYNQIYMAEEDIHKTTFRCPGALGMYEWVVMPFGYSLFGFFSPQSRD